MAAAATAGATSAFTETAVTFDGPEGYPLCGILCQPTSNSSSSINSSNIDGSSSNNKPFKPGQCAILCHGFASHKNGFHFPAIAHHLAENLGISSLRFDYTGNMDSPGPFRFASFMQEVQQMAAAKRYLEVHHGKQVVLLLGHSRGAINATMYSGQQGITLPDQQQQQQEQQGGQQGNPLQQEQPQKDVVQGGVHNSLQTDGSWSHIIPLVVLVAGRYDLTLNMHQRYGGDVVQQLQESGPRKQRTRRDGDGYEINWELDAQGMADRFSLDVSGACDTISRMEPSQRPKVLVLHGAADPICEASDAANLARHIKGSQLVEVEGADHWFKGRQQQLLDAVSAFAVQAGREQGLC